MRMEETTLLQTKVFRIISQLMSVSMESVNECSSPENMEKWDSFQHMNLILALEEEFKVRFSDEEILQMGNARLIIDMLQQKM
jgi:acyl carrier protein